ncbi:MAG: hypothetical protein H7Y61_00105 [Rhizobiales bacterium]|nr:hypothetical protein [Rhizobacter sp.]
MSGCTVGGVAAALLLVAAQAFALAPAPSDQEAQRAHAQGSCGKMGPGTGLSGNKGWVVSMMPGKHQFRVRGGAGQVYVTAARQSVVDFDVGRPYYLVVEGAGPAPVLEWKIPGSEWGVVSNYFLYPLSK